MPGGHVVAVGHVGLTARDLEGLARLYRATVGLTPSVSHAGVVAIFEVGDVDVFLSPGDPATASFDLAVDDVDAFRARLVASGVPCGEAKDSGRSGHRSFAFADPDGNRVQVTSAHQRATPR